MRERERREEANRVVPLWVPPCGIDVEMKVKSIPPFRYGRTYSRIPNSGRIGQVAAVRRIEVNVGWLLCVVAVLYLRARISFRVCALDLFCCFRFLRFSFAIESPSIIFSEELKTPSQEYVWGRKAQIGHFQVCSNENTLRDIEPHPLMVLEIDVFGFG